MSTKVLIGSVAVGKPSWDYTESVFYVQTPGEKAFKRIVGKQGIANGHNRMDKFFLENTDCEWMLHIDADCMPHPQTLMRLLSWDEPMVSALAFQRKPPFVPVFYRGAKDVPGEDYQIFGRDLGTVLQWAQDHQEALQLGKPIVLDPRPDDALKEVDRGGAHCLLTHRSVIEDVGLDAWEPSGARIEEGKGSDFTFYRKAREAGYTPYVDMSVIAGHMTGDMCVGLLDFVVWSGVCKWSNNGKTATIDLGLRK